MNGQFKIGGKLSVGAHTKVMHFTLFPIYGPQKANKIYCDLLEIIGLYFEESVLRNCHEL